MIRLSNALRGITNPRGCARHSIFGDCTRQVIVRSRLLFAKVSLSTTLKFWDFGKLKILQKIEHMLGSG